LHIKIYLEALKIDDNQENQDGGDNLVDVWKTAPQKSVLKGINLIRRLDQRVK